MLSMFAVAALSFAAGWVFRGFQSSVAHLDFNASNGEIRDKQIRYMLIRPDSIMGIFSLLDLPTAEKALLALQESVYEASSRSFREYSRRSSNGSLVELESQVFRVAGILGWGKWEVVRRSCTQQQPQKHEYKHEVEVLVTNSPFTIDRPDMSDVLNTWQYAPIAGVLRALYTIMAAKSPCDQSPTDPKKSQEGCQAEVQAVVEVLRMEGTSCTFRITHIVSSGSESRLWSRSCS
jgi:hypothetical protein